jgi:hypothetical protein
VTRGTVFFGKVFLEPPFIGGFLQEVTPSGS